MKSMDLQTSYDRVAEKYVELFFHELDKKPLDRELLNRLAVRVKSLGHVCDMGCGPGQIGRYLKEQGADVLGIDLSPGMVEQAQRLNPDIEFKQGDMAAMTVEDEAWGGIAAFYCIIHIPREKVTKVFREWLRVLRPGGLLLLSFHLGQELLHLDELWDEEVNMDVIFFTREEMEGYLREAGFEVEETVERDPYPDVEYQSRRAYIFAKKH